MDKIKLKCAKAKVTVVSNEFLDNYMIKANGEYVKVYLYLLRCVQGNMSELSIDYLAEKLENTENDIIRAVKYWAAQELILVEYNGKHISSIEFADGKNETVEETYETETEPVLKQEEIIIDSEEENDDEELSSKEIPLSRVEQLMEDEDVIMLLYIVEKYVGRTFSSSDTNTILYFYEELGFSVELIEFLVEHCVSNSHTSLRYIEKVALSWKEAGVTNVREAKNYLNAYAKSCYPVLMAFGLQGRNPAATERAFVLKWTSEYGFDMELIVDACNRTIDAIHQPSFKYADKILEGWHKKGVKTLADIRALDDEHEKIKENNQKIKSEKRAEKKEAPKTQFGNFEQRNYDYDELERQLLQRG